MATALVVIGFVVAVGGVVSDDPSRPIGFGPGLYTLAGLIVFCAGLWTYLGFAM